MAADDVTVIESTTDSGEQDPYRQRHAVLAGAGIFERVVAQGGMGAVILVLGVPVSPNVPSVLKMIRSELLEDEDTVSRFRRELANHHRLSRRLQVPRIVPCLAAYPDLEAASIHGVFPFYPDGTLADYISSGGTVTDGLRIIADAAEGLQSLHGLQVVHRDVCPKNIFVSREGGRVRGVLGDLGVAVPLEANTIFTVEQVDADLKFRTGHVGYIDPWHPGTVNGDLFSLGATLFWLLVGSDPPQAPGDGGLQLPAAAACRAAETAAVVERGREVVRRLTCREASSRFANVPEARSAIAELAALAQEYELPSPRRRAGVGWAVGIAAGVALSIVVGWGIASRENERPEAPVGPTSEPVAQAALQAEQAAAADVTLEEVFPNETAVESEAPPTVPVPPNLIRAASSLLETGDVAAAESLLRDLLSRYPNDPEAAGMLAPLLSRQGNAGLAEARTILTNVLERSPERGDLRISLARVVTQMGEPGSGAEILAAAPTDTTHADEIESLAVTLASLAHRTQ